MCNVKVNVEYFRSFPTTACCFDNFHLVFTSLGLIVLVSSSLITSSFIYNCKFLICVSSEIYESSFKMRNVTPFTAKLQRYVFPVKDEGFPIHIIWNSIYVTFLHIKKLYLANVVSGRAKDQFTHLSIVRKPFKIEHTGCAELSDVHKSHHSCVLYWYCRAYTFTLFLNTINGRVVLKFLQVFASW